MSGHMVIIGSGNDLVLIQHEAITWTNDNFFSISPSGINLNEISANIKSISEIVNNHSILGKEAIYRASVSYQFWLNNDI